MNRQADEFGAADAALVRAAQRGERTAFAELVRRYQDRVYNTCYRMCRSDADALDLTQSTFVKALEALPQFEARSSFHTWLFRIAVNLVFSQRRQRLRRPTVSLDEPLGDGQSLGLGGSVPARDGPSAADVLDAREMHERVTAALAQVEPEFRAAVVLKDIEDLDYAAIAEILEVPVGTVKSRIHRGRMMLRALLAEPKAELNVRRA